MLKKKDVKNEKEGCEKRQRIEMGSKNRKQTGRDNQLCYLQTPEVWQLKDQPQKKVQFNRPTTKTTIITTRMMLKTRTIITVKTARGTKEKRKQQKKLQEKQ